MKGVVCHGFNEGSVEELPHPEPREGEVLIKVKRAQLSAPECRLYRGQEIRGYDKIAKRMASGSVQLFGHEFCGVVEEVGEGVQDLSPGDRVYPAGKIPCESCGYCRTGFQHYCPNKTEIGYDRPGGLAEYVVQPTGPLCKLPDEVSDAEGAAMQPLAVRSLRARPPHRTLVRLGFVNRPTRSTDGSGGTHRELPERRRSSRR